MTDSGFTQQPGLVEPITEQGWFRRPAGREGYDIVVLEKVSTGNRYYTTLRPGETLRFGEVVLGKFLVYAVDMRYGLSFPVEGRFATQERNCYVELGAAVRYHVTDSRQVALGALDPLGELRDRVLDALNREFARYPHQSVNEAVCADIIRKVGAFPHLGLAIDSAEILKFAPEERVVGYRTAEEEQTHQHRMEERDRSHRHRIETRDAAVEQQLAGERERLRMDLDAEKIERFDLRDPNTFMHQRPDLVQDVLAMMSERERMNLHVQEIGVNMLAKALDAYIQQKHEAGEEFISLDEVTDFVRKNFLSGLLAQGVSSGRIDFGDLGPSIVDQSSAPSKRIDFADDRDEKKPPRIEFGKESE